ncbi:MAG: penicillin-binding protein 2, partial [Pseudomonadales bacterium]|nr:penicillin-binding protein 2 [Pseudomonadales bacterium]
EGTARLGEVSGLRIAGKTGTSRKVSSTGYQDDRHIALFVGMVPAAAPKLLMAVVVNEPRGEFYSGGTVAAPIFARLIEKTFRLVEGNAARPLSMSARDLPDGDA